MAYVFIVLFYMYWIFICKFLLISELKIISQFNDILSYVIPYFDYIAPV